MKILSFFCFIFLASGLFAQVPQAFNYQGIARDTDGTPLANKNISLRVTLREGGATGFEVYREVHAIQTNKLGLFAVEVGRGQPEAGEFNLIQWATGNHFIQTEIDAEGGHDFVQMGVAQLLSVPYALHAGNSNSSGGQWQDNATGINYDLGMVGLGTSSPAYKLDLIGNNATGESRYYINLHNQSQSSRSIAGMKILAGEGDHYTSLEHVSSSYDWDGDRYSDFGQLYSGGKGLVLRADQNDAVIKFFVGTEGIFGLERMRINALGNVGIGTEAPAARLQVADGDVFIEDIDKGVIMKSPDGNCWRVTVLNDGTLKSTGIACPN